MAPRIIFIHLPKTGGNTLGSYFADVFPPEQRWVEAESEPAPPGLTHPPRRALSLGLQDAAKFVSYDRLCASFRHFIPDRPYYFGHFKFGFHAALDGKPFRYVTVLRHPLERTISHLHTWHSLSPEEIPNYRALIDVATRAQRFYDIDNYQTRRLCHFGLSVEACDETVYLHAIANLREHFSFGFTELMPATVKLVGKELGLSFSEDERKRNVTIEGAQVQGHPDKRLARMPITDEDRAEILQRHQWDLRLYDEAMMLFRERLARHDIEMPASASPSLA